MKNIQKSKLASQLRRRARTRAKIYGTAKIPRLSVARSLKHICAQLIDDASGKTSVYICDTKLKAKDLKDAGERQGKVARAYTVGKMIAEGATEKKIKKVVFDRAHRKYHGRVRAVAEGARDGGLEF